MKTESSFEKRLETGDFAFTVSVNPPRGTNAEEIRKKVSGLKDIVDAVNVTDNQSGEVRMSSLAAAILLSQEGLEPVFHMICRDRNRLAMQSDILGAYAHGIRNIFCLSGNLQKPGDHPKAKDVFDIDSIQLIHMVKMMREEGKFLDGDDIEEPPKIFIGAAANPFADPFEWRVQRLALKIEAGADFILTSSVFDMDAFKKWINQAGDMGLTEKAYILAGVTPLMNTDMAEELKKTPGSGMPDELIKRFSDVDKAKQEEEGIKIACEQIEKLKGIKGLAGIHLMAPDMLHKVPEIAEQAGLMAS